MYMMPQHMEAPSVLDVGGLGWGGDGVWEVVFVNAGSSCNGRAVARNMLQAYLSMQ